MDIKSATGYKKIRAFIILLFFCLSKTINAQDNGFIQKSDFKEAYKSTLNCFSNDFYYSIGQKDTSIFIYKVNLKTGIDEVLTTKFKISLYPMQGVCCLNDSIFAFISFKQLYIYNILNNQILEKTIPDFCNQILLSANGFF